jgi:hypothetical protein
MDALRMFERKTLRKNSFYRMLLLATVEPLLSVPVLVYALIEKYHVPAARLSTT